MTSSSALPKKLTDNPILKGRLALFESPSDILPSSEEFLAWFQEQTALFARDVVKELPWYADGGRVTASLDALMHYRQVVYDAVMLGDATERRLIAANAVAEEAVRELVAKEERQRIAKEETAKQDARLLALQEATDRMVAAVSAPISAGDLSDED